MRSENADSDDDRWRRVERLVCDALALPAEERAAWLDRECDGDDALHAEVESLLAGESQVDGFLEPGTARIVVEASSELPDPWVGRHVGGFELRAPIGAGGMGRVYEAWQDPPGRAVAVKVVGPLSAAAEARRFEVEASILARLRHPNIAHLYDSGFVDDPFGAGLRLPWLAMELVTDARPITRYARDESLGLAQRIDLLLPVCDAVHHAHQRGVLHRDLKPSNLLVDGDGRPRVIDFGIARCEDRADASLERTRTGQLLGTLHWISPEQCSTTQGEVDARSDVYSLGLVAYELVTGSRPYDLADTTLYGAIRIICEEAPRRPSAIEPRSRGDLETILLKALEKDPDDRYPSVSELAADLRSWLASEPIRARRPTWAHRARLFARRDPLAALGLAAAAVALVAGSIAATTFGLREADAAREARRQASIASAVREFLTDDLLGAADPWSGGEPDLRVRDVVDRAAKDLDGRFEDEPLVEAGVRETLGRVYLSISRPAEALPQLERARDLLAAEFGRDAPQVLAVRDHLARACLEAGDIERARSEIDGVLASAPEGLLHARALATRGELLRRTAQPDDALPDLERAYAALREARGEDEIEVLAAGNSVAVTLREVGRLEDAEALQRRILADSRRLAGDEHPRTLASLANLALVVQDRGQLDEARQLLEECVRTSARVLGEDHEGTLLDRRNFALVLSQLGALDEAEEQIAMAVAGCRARFGDDHHHTIAAEAVLANLLLRRGDVDRAEPLLRDTIVRAREAIGPRDVLVAEATLGLTRLLTQRGENAEAVALLRETLGDGLRSDATEAELAMANQLGNLLLASGAAAEAEPLLAQVVEALRARLGTHIGTAMGLATHGRCLVALGRRDEARTALLESREMLTGIVGAEHARTKMVDAELTALDDGR